MPMRWTIWAILAGCAGAEPQPSDDSDTGVSTETGADTDIALDSDTGADTDPDTDADTDLPPDTDVSPVLPMEGCEVSGNGSPGGPVEDPYGPYYHNAVGSTISGGTVVSDVEFLVDHASVPDGALVGGEPRMYYVNGADASIWTASLDALGAAEPIAIDDLLYPVGLADPDAVSMEDGGVRLFLLQRTQTRHSICVAESADGVHFEMLGRAAELPTRGTLTDPSVTRLDDGSWLMSLSHGTQTRLARSEDGYAFVLDEGELQVGGVGELTTADGELRLYTCASGNIQSWTSEDALAFELEGVVVTAASVNSPSICDPSRIVGTDIFLFKTVDP